MSLASAPLFFGIARCADLRPPSSVCSQGCAATLVSVQPASHPVAATCCCCRRAFCCIAVRTPSHVAVAAAAALLVNELRTVCRPSALRAHLTGKQVTAVTGSGHACCTHVPRLGEDGVPWLQRAVISYCIADSVGADGATPYGPQCVTAMQSIRGFEQCEPLSNINRHTSSAHQCHTWFSARSAVTLGVLRCLLSMVTPALNASHHAPCAAASIIAALPCAVRTAAASQHSCFAQGGRQRASARCPQVPAVAALLHTASFVACPWAWHCACADTEPPSRPLPQAQAAAVTSLRRIKVIFNKF
jgi:hypothetical protein